MTNTIKQTADRVRELTAALNDEMRKAAGMGLRVEVDTVEVGSTGTWWPMPRIDVMVTKEVKSESEWPPRET